MDNYQQEKEKRFQELVSLLFSPLEHGGYSGTQGCIMWIMQLIERGYLKPSELLEVIGNRLDSVYNNN